MSGQDKKKERTEIGEKKLGFFIVWLMRDGGGGRKMGWVIFHLGPQTSIPPNWRESENMNNKWIYYFAL